MGNEWGEAKHRKRRSPMDTGGRPIDPRTGKLEKTMIERWLESLVKPRGKRWLESLVKPRGKHER